LCSNFWINECEGQRCEQEESGEQERLVHGEGTIRMRLT
jgi:hypothetical protein